MALAALDVYRSRAMREDRRHDLPLRMVDLPGLHTAPPAQEAKPPNERRGPRTRPTAAGRHAVRRGELGPLIAVFSSYVLSFVYVGIYWNNHHHLLPAAQKVNGAVLWANLHLLFWLSLFPFVTGWMGENHFAPWPVAVYGLALLMAAVAYSILVSALLKLHGHDSKLAAALGHDRKGNRAILAYVDAVALSFFERGPGGGL